MSVAGGVALSVTLAFAFTPQMFALTLPRRRAPAREAPKPGAQAQEQRDDMNMQVVAAPPNG